MVKKKVSFLDLPEICPLEPVRLGPIREQVKYIA